MQSLIYLQSVTGRQAIGIQPCLPVKFSAVNDELITTRPTEYPSPARSGFPSAALGTGASRSGATLDLRGMFAAGGGTHCAAGQSYRRITASIPNRQRCLVLNMNAPPNDLHFAS